MATLVDSNIILDVVSEDEDWVDWSSAMLGRAAETGRLVINPIVYAEVSVGFDTIEALDAALPASYYAREALPWDAASFSRRERIFPTAAREAAAGQRCPISTSVRTLPSPVTRFSRATRDDIARTFQP